MRTPRPGVKIPTYRWDPLPSPMANSEPQSGGMDSGVIVLSLMMKTRGMKTPKETKQKE